MRKFLVILICLVLAAPCALAENTETMVVDYGVGSLLLSKDGTPLTEVGEYESINQVTTDDCDPSRVLYYATTTSAISYPYDASDDQAVEEWPQDGGGLEESDVPDDATIAPEETAGATAEATGSAEDGDKIGASDGEIQEFDNGGVETNVALMDAAGNLLTDYDYTMFTHDVQNAVVIAYRTDGFVSALDEKGKVLLEGKYAAIVSDTVGGFYATKPDLTQTDAEGNFPVKSELFHISADGTETDTGIVTGTDDLGGFSSGFMCLAKYDSLDATDDFGTDEAEATTPPADAEVKDTTDPEAEDGTGLEDAHYIFIDVSGADAFGKVFTGAYNFVGNYADVTDDNYNERLIDLSGEYVTEKAYNWFDLGKPNDGMPIVANLVDGGFDLLSREDLSVVKEFTLPSGETSLYAYQSGDGLIFAFSDTTVSVINAAGDAVYTGDASVYAYTDYRANDSVPERILTMTGESPKTQCQMLDLSGNPVGATYQEISALSWVNGKGRYLVASYDVGDAASGGDAQQEPNFESYRYGVIDQDGNAILETKYTELTYLTADRYWVCDGSVYQLVDSNGKAIYEMKVVQ